MKVSINKGVALFALSVCLFSCKKDNDSTETPNGVFNESLNSFVKGLPSVQQREPFAERLVANPKPASISIPSENGTFILSEVREVAASDQEFEQAIQVDEQLLFSDDQEIFYPGALLKAKSVIDGTYLPIVSPRKPLKLSVSLIGANPSVTVEKPTLSTVREAVSSLLSERKFDTPPANISYSSDEVHDEKHLKIALGANYSGTSTSVKASTGFSYDNQKTRFLVKIQQVFYTIDVDMPEKPSDFFSDSFDYKTAFGDEKPLYISSIKMGRVFILGIETSLSKIEAEAKINASFLKGSFTADAETAFRDLAKTSTIRGRVLGGNSSLAGGTISDISAVKKFLEEGASFSRENPGIPISYKLRELGTNQTFKTIIYSKYVKSDGSDNQKMDFLLYLEEGRLKDPFGNDLRTGKGYIERRGLSKAPDRKEIFFSRNSIHQNIKAFEKGEQISVIFDRTKMGDKYNQEYIFDLPSLPELLKRAREVGKEHLYDNNNGTALTIKDRTNTLILILELENQKIYQN